VWRRGREKGRFDGKGMALCVGRRARLPPRWVMRRCTCSGGWRTS
jgi:hypothetical protein